MPGINVKMYWLIFIQFSAKAIHNGYKACFLPFKFNICAFALVKT